LAGIAEVSVCLGLALYALHIFFCFLKLFLSLVNRDDLLFSFLHFSVGFLSRSSYVIGMLLLLPMQLLFLDRKSANLSNLPISVNGALGFGIALC
tara:strand:- start:12326 stop:12610 length:285 start_codon:yes stop_codon:yes gene_type:complete